MLILKLVCKSLAIRRSEKELAMSILASLRQAYSIESKWQCFARFDRPSLHPNRYDYNRLQLRIQTKERSSLHFSKLKICAVKRRGIRSDFEQIKFPFHRSTQIFMILYVCKSDFNFFLFAISYRR